MKEENLEKLKLEYLKMFEKLIDLAFEGKEPKFFFCDGAYLKLVLGEDGMLHWEHVNG
jgi:hypothetical protein